MQTPAGHIHPLSRTIQEINTIFGKMGFSYVEGPEVESEFYNFDALNIPGDHPARDMWDTFWLRPENSRKLLRTHTSPVQVRYLEQHQNQPVRIIAPGKVYRHEATDATHEAQFYQLEGLAIGTDITLAHLKGVLEQFFKEFYGRPMEVRFRPSYFPFTEPSVEVDVKHTSSRGEKWLEVMGAGMVHPKVLEATGFDSTKWQGFAFGTGIERLAMIKYEIDDVRVFHNGDLRFVNQF
jgi:phenylalanyl-tRNA synthetase alpha chain